jgi:AraC family transcriptional activator of mtrCDE
MPNALSTAMFALVLRLASETEDAPRGLLALADHPHFAPSLAALFNESARAGSLPGLARQRGRLRSRKRRRFRDGSPNHGVL